MKSFLLLFSALLPSAIAHSWPECWNWEFDNKAAYKNPSIRRWEDKDGTCTGFPRTTRDGGNGFKEINDAPCGDGSGEWQDQAWGNKQVLDNPRGKVGEIMCMKWPANNHQNDPFGSVTAVTDGRTVDSGTTYIRINPTANTRGTHSVFNANFVATMSFTNCPFGDFIIPGPPSDSDFDFTGSARMMCGGCFEIPDLPPGTYDTQWYWVLFGEEDYFNCANLEIVAGACTDPDKCARVATTAPSSVGGTTPPPSVDSSGPPGASACAKCQAGGASDGGVPLENGRCAAFCSTSGHCGTAEVYKTGGTDCSAKRCNMNVWSGVDQTCGECTALTRTAETYLSCDGYCAAQEDGLECIGAWEENGNSCTPLSQESCSTNINVKYQNTPDFICECSVPSGGNSGTTTPPSDGSSETFLPSSPPTTVVYTAPNEGFDVTYKLKVTVARESSQLTGNALQAWLHRLVAQLQIPLGTVQDVTVEVDVDNAEWAVVTFSTGNQDYSGKVTTLMTSNNADFAALNIVAAADDDDDPAASFAHGCCSPTGLFSMSALLLVLVSGL